MWVNSWVSTCVQLMIVKWILWLHILYEYMIYYERILQWYTLIYYTILSVPICAMHAMCRVCSRGRETCSHGRVGSHAWRRNRSHVSGFWGACFGLCLTAFVALLLQLASWMKLEAEVLCQVVLEVICGSLLALWGGIGEFKTDTKISGANQLLLKVPLSWLKLSDIPADATILRPIRMGDSKKPRWELGPEGNRHPAVVPLMLWTSLKQYRPSMITTTRNNSPWNARDFPRKAFSSGFGQWAKRLYTTIIYNEVLQFRHLQFSKFHVSTQCTSAGPPYHIPFISTQLTSEFWSFNVWRSFRCWLLIAPFFCMMALVPLVLHTCPVADEMQSVDR